MKQIYYHLIEFIMDKDGYDKQPRKKIQAKNRGLNQCFILLMRQLRNIFLNTSKNISQVLLKKTMM